MDSVHTYFSLILFLSNSLENLNLLFRKLLSYLFIFIDNLLKYEKKIVISFAFPFLKELFFNLNNMI